MSQYGDSQNIIRPPFRRHTPDSPAANSESPPERGLSLPQPPRLPGTPPNTPAAGQGGGSASDPANIRRRNQWREHQQLTSPYAAPPTASGSWANSSPAAGGSGPAQPSMPAPASAKKPLHLPSPPPRRAAAPLPPAAASRRAGPEPSPPAQPVDQSGGAFRRPAAAVPGPVPLRPERLRRLPPPPDLSIPREEPPRSGAFRDTAAFKDTAFKDSKVTPLRSHLPGRPTSRPASEGRDRPERHDRPDGAGRPGNRSQRKSRKTPLPLLYAIRLLILGVGVAAIAGTLLSALSPSQVNTPGASSQALAGAPAGALRGRGNTATVSSVPVTTEITRLKTALEQLATLTPGLTPTAFVLELDSGQYVDLAGAKTVAAASTIKMPILVAFLQAVDAGTLPLDRALTLESRHLVGGSGELQEQPVGTQYSALEVATQMIVTSDNTATNMMIDLLGGAEALNQQFQAWGLTTTVLRSPLPDLQGTNTTSPRDLALLLALVDRGELLSLRSRDRMWAIMQRTANRTLIPAGLTEGTIALNKTGDIGSVLGDVALIDTPTGRRYVLATLVERPTNDGRASELIRRIANQVHRELNQPIAPVGGTATPGTSTQEGFTESGSSAPATGSPTAPGRSGSGASGRGGFSQPSGAPADSTQDQTQGQTQEPFQDPALDPTLSDPSQMNSAPADPAQIEYPGGSGSGSGDMPGARMPQG